MSAAALSATFLLSACDLPDLQARYDKSEEHTVSNAADGKSSGLLAAWVPAGATDVHLLQRTTGDERLLKATYSGNLPASCMTLGTTGSPTDEELARSYAGDERTKDRPLDEVTTSPLLEADWWPKDQHRGTTALCGRWWVSQEGNTLYAFAPEQHVVAEGISSEHDDGK